MSFLKIFTVFILCTKIYAQDYNVKDFGAVGDGKTDDTNAIRAAFAAANSSNGGRVIFDSGSTFLTGCIQISSNLIIDVQGMILGSSDPMHYTFPNYTSDGWLSLIFGNKLSNITITGNGIIDGQGSPWWKCANNDSAPPCSGKGRPHLIYITWSSNITATSITLQNSPSFNLAFAHSHYIYINNITVLNPDSFSSIDPSYNTDGINLGSVTNVLIENSYISTGDDAIPIDSIALNYPSENIHVRNITVGTSHGLTLGSYTVGGIHNVTFEDIKCNGSHTGIYFRGQRGRGGLVKDITFKNIQMYNIGYCIRLSMNYTKVYTPPSNYTPIFENIVLQNITCNVSTLAWDIEGLNDSDINANINNVYMSQYEQLYQNCVDIYGTCSTGRGEK